MRHALIALAVAIASIAQAQAQDSTIVAELHIVGAELEQAGNIRTKALVLALTGATMTAICYTSGGENAARDAARAAALTIGISTVVYFNASAREQSAYQRLKHLSPP